MKGKHMTDLGCMILAYAVVIVLVIIGCGVAADYLIDVWLHANIAFVLDMIVGSVGSAVVVPVAIVVWILKMTGVLA